MKHTAILLIFLSYSCSLSSQIAVWNSTAGVGSTGVTAGTAVKGAGITNAAGTCTNNVLTNSAFFDAGDAGGLAEAVSQNEYVEFPITAQAGYTVTITSVTYTSRHSPTGVTDVAVYNGNSTNLGTNNQPTADLCETFTIDLTDVVINPGTTVNFRFYGWGSTNSGGNLRLAGVSFFGTSVLPIELTSFTAKLSGTSVNLNFSTASERNNDYFSIERSSNGYHFSEIGRVKGAGDSNVPQVYTFTDDEPLPGKNYYRLRQVDFDGKYAYSPVVSVKTAVESGLTLMPSPVQDQMKVVLDKSAREDGQWQVFDLNGRLMRSGVFPAESDEYQMDMPDLPEGAYVFRLTVGQISMSKSFWKN